jgi:archaellum component FlaF (FlaF/FlaG flagellin family)
MLIVCAIVMYCLWPNKITEVMDANHFHYLKENKDLYAKESTKELYANVNEESKESETKCGNFVSTDLLPKTNNLVDETQFKFAPNKDVKLLIKPTQTLIGMNTQGGSLKNANLDIRSSPSIEKKEVSPWLNSTIDPDMFRRPLE